MADRAFERIFNQTSAQQAAAEAAADPELRRQKAQQDEDSELRKLSSGMTAADAIQRILLAHKDRDYFRLLELPPPGVDALGGPCWDVSGADVSKAYRKLSILVHPDKNPGEAARLAFEALNEAHRALKDKDKLEGILAEHLEAAKRRADKELAGASLEDRLALQAAQAAQAKALRKAQGEALQQEVVARMKERQEAAKRKREAADKARYRRRDDSEDEEGGEAGAQAAAAAKEQAAKQQQAATGNDSDDGEDAAARRRALAKRRQQQRKPSGM